MSQHKNIVFGAAAVLVAVAAFWFLALTPQRDQAAKLDADIAAKQAQVDQSTGQLATYGAAKSNYKVNYTTMTRLGKAVPADDDVRSLLIQINDAANRSKVNFQSINIGAGASAAPEDAAASAPGTLAAAPGAVQVGSAGFSAMPFSFGFEGSFFRLSNFFERLENFVSVTNRDVDVTGRLLLLGSISLTAEKGDLRRLKAQVGAASYLAPNEQNLQAGGAPEVPGAVTPPASDGTTPTSATITGVR